MSPSTIFIATLIAVSCTPALAAPIPTLKLNSFLPSNLVSRDLIVEDNDAMLPSATAPDVDSASLFSASASTLTVSTASSSTMVSIAQASTEPASLATPLLSTGTPASSTPVSAPTSTPASSPAFVVLEFAEVPGSTPSLIASSIVDAGATASSSALPASTSASTPGFIVAEIEEFQGGASMVSASSDALASSVPSSSASPSGVVDMVFIIPENQVPPTPAASAYATYTGAPMPVIPLSGLVADATLPSSSLPVDVPSTASLPTSTLSTGSTPTLDVKVAIAESSASSSVHTTVTTTSEPVATTSQPVADILSAISSTTALPTPTAFSAQSASPSSSAFWYINSANAAVTEIGGRPSASAISSMPVSFTEASAPAHTTAPSSLFSLPADIELPPLLKGISI